jgi:hemoglobin
MSATTDSPGEARDRTNDEGDQGGDRPDAPTAFALIGGEPRIRLLVDRFYDLMAMDPRYARVLAMHPVVLDESRDKLFWFLCGWMGGPNHYIERFGHPRLRARHLPFPIGTAERDEWLACMAQALADLEVEAALFDRLMNAFAGTADFMRNRAG